MVTICRTTMRNYNMERKRNCLTCKRKNTCRFSVEMCINNDLIYWQPDESVETEDERHIRMHPVRTAKELIDAFIFIEDKLKELISMQNQYIFMLEQSGHTDDERTLLKEKI